MVDFNKQFLISTTQRPCTVDWLSRALLLCHLGGVCVELSQMGMDARAVERVVDAFCCFSRSFNIRQ